jgi:hypothetical protein
LQVDATDSYLSFSHIDNLLRSIVHYNDEQLNGCGNPNAMPSLIRVWAIFGALVLLMLVATVWRVGLKFKARFLERKQPFQAAFGQPQPDQQEETAEDHSIVNELQSWLIIIIIMLPNQAIASTPAAPRPSGAEGRGSTAPLCLQLLRTSQACTRYSAILLEITRHLPLLPQISSDTKRNNLVEASENDIYQPSRRCRGSGSAQGRRSSKVQVAK